MFRAVKTGGHLLVLAGSFLGAVRVLEELGHESPLPLAVLYLVLLEGAWLLLEAGDVQRRRFPRGSTPWGTEHPSRED